LWHLRWISRIVIALALLWPVVLVALDHHGAERIPEHEHVLPIGGTVTGHLHGFELPHTHVPAVAGAAPTTPTVAPPQASALIAMTLLEYIGLPLLAVVVALAGARRIRPPRRLALLHQITLGPPTPPPTIGASFC
jgi:hypothetical protein